VLDEIGASTCRNLVETASEAMEYKEEALVLKWRPNNITAHSHVRHLY
jgi:hypothetical protein